MKLCIIDCIGLTYDGNTLLHRGLGGSESAVILMSKELAKIGFDVTVFNNCEDTLAKPGIYDNVKYRPFSDLEKYDFTFDIMISSRTFIPFVPPELYHMFMPDQYGRMHNPKLFENIRSRAKLKIMWKHDTFCMGDPILEELVVNGYIDELFTLSDFHTTYVTNSEHGKKRIYEVLKNKVWQTRNGIVNYYPEVDISAKDKDLFVYNASITKGMLPLVHKIWPKVRERIPTAKLKIIGGYYRFRENAAPDEQEVMFHNLVKEKEGLDIGIEFTGIISQKEIAKTLTKASYFIFPCAFPETFGISSLEAINYNVPLLASKFGAVEETGIEMASYFTDYAIEPNSLAPWINTDTQVDKFVDMVVNAYNNTYLHQQKMYYCNIAKDVSTWDTVALQWKQHFYQKLSKHLPVDDFRKVQKINDKVHKVFGRRISNKEEWVNRKQKEKHITCVVPFYNSANYIGKTIESIASQDYDNYNVILINDASTDNSVQVLTDIIYSYPEHIRAKFTLLSNETNQGAVYNQYHAFPLIGEDDICMIIDGDDWLAYDNTIFDHYNNLYHDGAEFTYGSCWSLADNIPLIAQPYPSSVKAERAYRNHAFNWGMPYPHLRTFKGSLASLLTKEACQDEDGNWYRAGGDNAVFYGLIEVANPDKVIAVQDINYIYNDLNPLNDYKVNSVEQNVTATKIRTMMAEKKTQVKA